MVKTNQLSRYWSRYLYSRERNDLFRDTDDIPGHVSCCLYLPDSLERYDPVFCSYSIRLRVLN